MERTKTRNELINIYTSTDFDDGDAFTIASSKPIERRSFRKWLSKTMKSIGVYNVYCIMSSDCLDGNAIHVLLSVRLSDIQKKSLEKKAEYLRKRRKSGDSRYFYRFGIKGNSFRYVVEHQFIDMLRL
jgi:hypothetical protein